MSFIQRSRTWFRTMSRTATVLLAVVALTAAACGSDSDGGSGGEGGDDLISIKVGGQASITGSVDMIGLEKGFFEEEGLDVELIRLSSGKEVRDALISGSVNVGGVAPAPFAAAASSGELLAIATLGLIGDSVAVLAGADSGIETLEDLKGKKVGSQEGSSSELIFLGKVLPSVGYSADDVTMVNTEEADHPAVLASGQVDAVIANEPFISIAEQEGIGYIVTPYTPFDPFPNLVLGQRGYVDDNGEAVQRYVTAHVKTMQWMAENTEEAVEIIVADLSAQGVDLEPDIVASALGKVNLTPEFPSDLAEYLSETFQLLAGAGQVEGDEPNWSDMIEPKFLDEAL
ncbi:MAG: transporter substrate-binding domain-containing protein [Actinobacteria bacterium]|nr:transporter substrate-binding domain-containing protein [Actinomycetota bacterium]